MNREEKTGLRDSSDPRFTTRTPPFNKKTHASRIWSKATARTAKPKSNPNVDETCRLRYANHQSVFTVAGATWSIAKSTANITRRAAAVNTQSKRSAVAFKRAAIPFGSILYYQITEV